MASPRFGTPALTRRLLTAAIALVAALASAVPAHAAVADRAASMDGGGLARFDQLNTAFGALTVADRASYDGRRAAHAQIDGGGNAYSRGLFNVDWRDGDEVWYGAAFLLPHGFIDAMQGQVDLLRSDNWPTDPTTTDRSGVVIWHGDGRAHLIRQKLGVEERTLAKPFRLPEGRWFWLEIHQRLSRGSGALSEVFVNGRRVARSTAPNSYGRGVQRLRAGIVAVDAARQQRALDLYFDRVSISSHGPRGPVAQSRSSRRRAARAARHLRVVRS